MPLSLSEWETFYVITGSSGAALTGLMFVVITLAADRFKDPRRVKPTEEMNAFSTPTVVHFGIVLLVASIMTVPHANALSLGIALLACAAVGLIYNISNMRRMRRLNLYQAVTEDWVWHVILPFVAYVSLLTGVALLWRQSRVALHVVAGFVLLLLFIGIHNAWDVALYTALQSELALLEPEPGAAPPAPAPESAAPETRPVGAADGSP